MIQAVSRTVEARGIFPKEITLRLVTLGGAADIKRAAQSLRRIPLVTPRVYKVTYSFSIRRLLGVVHRKFSCNSKTSVAEARGPDYGIAIALQNTTRARPEQMDSDSRVEARVRVDGALFTQEMSRNLAMSP